MYFPCGKLFRFFEVTVNESKITIAGITGPLLQAGDESSSEAVVFVHGNPGLSHEWDRLIEKVGRFGRAVAFDMPGFGHADKPADWNYSVQGFADHLQAGIEHLGIKKVHLVVHDFGGPWGMHWAGMYPDRLASVVLLNSGLWLDYDWHFVAKIWRTPWLGELFMAITTRPAFHILCRIGNPRGIPNARINAMFDTFDKGTRNAVLKLYRSSPHPDPAVTDLAAKLKPYNRPALVVWGKADPYLPARKLAERQKDGFPSARIEIFEDSGHWPYHDNPERADEVILTFLEEQYQRG